MPDSFSLLCRLRDRPELLDEIASSTVDEFRLQAQLRKRYPDDLVREALRLADLRTKATAKFTRADQMWLERIGLEQSTAEPIGIHKSNRFRQQLGEGTEIHDLCTGLGGDAIALAQHFDVTTIDCDPVMLTRAAWNAEVYGRRDRMRPVCADISSIGLTDSIIHIDPDRRTDAQKSGSKSRRSLRVEDMQPSLETIRHLMAHNRGGAIKLSPASNFGGKFDDVTIELVSLNGECKEATIWFGEMADSETFRATVLPANEFISGDPLDAWTEVQPPGEYIYDPDPSVVRSGLVDVLAAKLGLTRMDDAEEYLTGDALIESPFMTPFRIREQLPYRKAELKACIKRDQIGSLEVKCRHVSLNADQLRKKLKPKGSNSATLIIAKVEGKASAFVCERC